MGRYDRVRRYWCAHPECPVEAVLLSPGCPGQPSAHNCCGLHVELED